MKKQKAEIIKITRLKNENPKQKKFMMEIMNPIAEKAAKQSILGFLRKKILPLEDKSKIRTRNCER